VTRDNLTAELADDYGVTDVDGRRIDSMREKRGVRCGVRVRRTTIMANDRVQTLIDWQDIVDCLSRFSRGMDRFDRDDCLSAFHYNAVFAQTRCTKPGKC
jgi:hypothetical protein